MPLTSAISVTTISSSMRVTPDSFDRAQHTACCALEARHAQRTTQGPRPRRLLVAPANNVCVVPFSARLPVGAQRNDVRLVTVLAGELVEIRMAPNIGGGVLRKIRAGPLIDPVRLQDRK